MTLSEYPRETGIDDRVIRVFLSSTFRDMQEERDILSKIVFPQLRKLCEQRDVSWKEVDLRWGITVEQSERGEVLQICLVEIDRCRPYFIGLIGERYGWIPDRIDPAIAESRSWIASLQDRSVTELEIRHGVLNDPEMTGRAIFFFRDSDYLNHLPAGATAEDYSSEGATEARKLGDLKNEIVASGFPVNAYSDPEALGALVLEQMTGIIDELYPEGSEPDPLSREATLQAKFVRTSADVYISDAPNLKKLDDHIRSSGTPLVLVGEAGSGKSALLANWLLHRQSPIEPQAAESPSLKDRLTGVFGGSKPDGGDVRYISHFVGASFESANFVNMARRLIGEVNEMFGVGIREPDGPEDTRRAFQELLAAVGESRLVLVIDGLDLLEDRDRAHTLFWLPVEVPPNVRLILSTSGGRTLEETTRRKWKSLSIGPLNEKGRRDLCVQYLAKYTKQLTEKNLSKIVSGTGSKIPLHSRLLLEELRLHGDHETLDDKIESSLQAETIEDLYDQILARCEADFEKDRPGLIGEALSLLWLSRRGLSETELLQVLGEPGKPLPQAFWSPVFLALEASLTVRSGLIAIARQQFRDAVERRFLASESENAATRATLVRYFEGEERTLRVASELAWQFAESSQWQKLFDLLSDLEVTKKLADADPFEFFSYWARIRRSSELREVDAYRALIDSKGKIDVPLCNTISNLLALSGFCDEAAVLLEKVAAEMRATGDLPGVAETLGSLSMVHQTAGEGAKAYQLLLEQESIYRELGEEMALATCLGNQGTMLLFHDSKKAIELFKEQERLARKLGNEHAIEVSVGNLGEVHYHRGELIPALRYFKEQEEICRVQNDEFHLVSALIRMASVQRDLGDRRGALALFFESRAISERIGDWEHLSRSLEALAQIFSDDGDHNNALDALRRQEEVCRQFLEPADLALCVANQAGMFVNQNDIPSAIESFRRAESIHRELGDDEAASRCEAEQRVLSMRQAAEAGDVDAMMQIGQIYLGGDALEANYQAAAHWFWRASEAGHVGGMINLAALLMQEGGGIQPDFAEARRLLKKAAERGESRAMNNLGVIHEKGLGVDADDEAALEWYRRAAELGNDGAMNAIGWLYAKSPATSFADDAKAVEWYRRAAEADNPVAMFNLAGMHHDGRGTPVNGEAALQWLERSANGGYPSAMMALAKLHQEGNGVEKDPKTAFEWFAVAAERGVIEAMRELFIIYRDGIGVEKNQETAIAWLHRAADSGDSWARDILREIGRDFGR